MGVVDAEVSGQQLPAQEAEQVDDEIVLVKAWIPKRATHPQAFAVRVALQLRLSQLTDPEPQRRFMLIKWVRIAAAEVGFCGDSKAGRTELAILLGMLKVLVKLGYAKVVMDVGITFKGVPPPDEIELALLQQHKDAQQERLKQEENARAEADRLAAIAAQKLAEQVWSDPSAQGADGDQAGKTGVFTYVRDGVEAFDARHGVVRGTTRGTWSGAKSKAQALRGKTFALRASTQVPGQGLLHPAPAPVEVVPRRIPRAEIEATQSRKPDGRLAPNAQAQPAAEPSPKVVSEAGPAGAAEDRIASQVSEHRARRLRQLASRRATLQVVPIVKAPEEDGGLGMLDLINGVVGADRRSR